MWNFPSVQVMTCGLFGSWRIINYTLRLYFKIETILKNAFIFQNRNNLTEENWFDTAVCKTLAICLSPQCGILVDVWRQTVSWRDHQSGTEHGTAGPLPRKGPWQQGSWGQHGAHLGPTGPRWASCWPHELFYLGIFKFDSLAPARFEFNFGLVIFKLFSIGGWGISCESSDECYWTLLIIIQHCFR